MAALPRRGDNDKVSCRVQSIVEKRNLFPVTLANRFADSDTSGDKETCRVLKRNSGIQFDLQVQPCSANVGSRGIIPLAGGSGRRGASRGPLVGLGAKPKGNTLAGAWGAEQVTGCPTGAFLTA